MQVFDGNEIELNFDEGRDNVSPGDRGKTCFVYRGELLNEVCEYFGRPSDGLCLKIFFDPLEGEIEAYDWGKKWRKYSRDRCEEIGRLSKLTEATTIQNWLWMKDLAPRVYAIVLIERNGKQYPAQLTEFERGSKYETVQEVQDQLDVIEKELEKFKVGCAHRELIGRNDFLGGKVIDLQGYRFTNETRAAVKDWVESKGKYGKTHYQEIEKMGIMGKPRKTDKRIKAMKLDGIDFEGKDVLDVGCNSGAFCMYATDRGARRVMGIDLAHHIQAARALNFFLGYHNVEYYSEDINEMEVIAFEDIDITLFLSMNIHVGFPEWVANTKLLIFEENAKQSKFNPACWQEELSRYFDDVKMVGTTNDQNEKYYKPIFHCRKT